MLNEKDIIGTDIKIQFCTQPDRNGNFLLLDIFPKIKAFRHGYCYRFANRADNIVLSRKEVGKLVDQLKAAYTDVSNLL